jgi:hypothetical protein
MFHYGDKGRLDEATGAFLSALEITAREPALRKRLVREVVLPEGQH